MNKFLLLALILGSVPSGGALAASLTGGKENPPPSPQLETALGGPSAGTEGSNRSLPPLPPLKTPKEKADSYAESLRKFKQLTKARPTSPRRAPSPFGLGDVITFADRKPSRRVTPSLSPKAASVSRENSSSQASLREDERLTTASSQSEKESHEPQDLSPSFEDHLPFAQEDIQSALSSGRESAPPINAHEPAPVQEFVESEALVLPLSQGQGSAAPATIVHKVINLEEEPSPVVEDTTKKKADISAQKQEQKGKSWTNTLGRAALAALLTKWAGNQLEGSGGSSLMLQNEGSGSLNRSNVTDNSSFPPQGGQFDFSGPQNYSTGVTSADFGVAQGPYTVPEGPTFLMTDEQAEEEVKRAEESKVKEPEIKDLVDDELEAMFREEELRNETALRKHQEKFARQHTDLSNQTQKLAEEALSIQGLKPGEPGYRTLLGRAAGDDEQGFNQGGENEQPLEALGTLLEESENLQEEPESVAVENEPAPPEDNEGDRGFVVEVPPAPEKNRSFIGGWLNKVAKAARDLCSERGCTIKTGKN